ncbi:MAG: hypothetical protein KTR30_24330 [Saprospiraceae bacterium]|nr:hypothetical protein [Saprospiraceae bacterium]
MITRLHKALLIITSLLLCIGLRAQIQEMTPVQWQEDLQYLENKLKKQFKNPDANLTPLLFDGLQKLKKQVGQLSNEKLAVELGKTLATQQDGHTELDLMQTAVDFNRLPINFYFFGKDLYIFNTSSDHQDLLGKKVLSIDGVGIEDVFQRLLPIMPADNKMETIHMAPIYMLAPRLLFELGITSAPNTVQLQLADGGAVAIDGITIQDYQKIEWKNVKDLKNLSPPLYLQNHTKSYWHTYLEESNIFYFKYNRVRNQKGEKSIASFTKSMFAEIDRIRPSKLIIDMRHNRGGNYNLSKPLIKGILKRSWLNQPDKIFIFTSRVTFSAASATTLFLKRDAKVTIVGEHSRSKPNGSQNSEVMELPHSKLRISYTNRLIVHWPDKGTDKLPPLDIPLALRFEDYAQAKDPLLDWVLQQ